MTKKLSDAQKQAMAKLAYGGSVSIEDTAALVEAIAKFKGLSEVSAADAAAALADANPKATIKDVIKSDVLAAAMGLLSNSANDLADLMAKPHAGSAQKKVDLKALSDEDLLDLLKNDPINTTMADLKKTLPKNAPPLILGGGFDLAVPGSDALHMVYGKPVQAVSLTGHAYTWALPHSNPAEDWAHRQWEQMCKLYGGSAQMELESLLAYGFQLYGPKVGATDLGTNPVLSLIKLHHRLGMDSHWPYATPAESVYWTAPSPALPSELLMELGKRVGTLNAPPHDTVGSMTNAPTLQDMGRSFVLNGTRWWLHVIPFEVEKAVDLEHKLSFYVLRAWLDLWDLRHLATKPEAAGPLTVERLITLHNKGRHTARLLWPPTYASAGGSGLIGVALPHRLLGPNGSGVRLRAEFRASAAGVLTFAKPPG